MLDPDFMLKSSTLFYLGGEPKDQTWERATGLYTLDTRYLNAIQVVLNEQPLKLLAAMVHHATAATVTSANTTLMLDDGATLLPHHIAVEQRLALDSSLRVALALESYARKPVSLELGIVLSADFRDVFEIRGFQRESRGNLLRPHARKRSIRLRYRGLDNLVAGTEITFDRDPRFELSRVVLEHGETFVLLLPGEDDIYRQAAEEARTAVLACFPVELAPRERWELQLEVQPKPPEALTWPAPPVVFSEPSSSRSRIVTDNPFFNRLLDRSLDDLAMLKTSFPHGDIIAAGIPWYVAPFGRDSLIAGLQTFHLAPNDAEGTLRILAALQGKTFDDFTEEQPGKILHEMRYGEMARCAEVPHRPYYGTSDATSLFVLLFAETVAWTADDALYLELLPGVKAALDWIEIHGDLDGDGFIEYWADRTDPVRIRHQVWKDSFDSLHHPDGREPSGNVAPVEVQGYSYAAYMRLADVAAAFGDLAFADSLTDKAARLRERFNAQFWIEEEQFYAQALDGDKTPIPANASNPGQLLITGILPSERAEAVVRRLKNPDMDSGWGIRTLSTGSIAYNPMSYHNGSVWPHINSVIAAGCYAAGATEAGHALFEALYDAGRHAVDDRLNELYCGFSRGGGATDTPVPYPTACSPQAWAAGCYPHLIRSSLGLAADIRGSVLRISPTLPPFVNEVSLHDVTALGKTGSLRVCRDGEDYQIESDGLPLERVEAGSSLPARA